MHQETILRQDSREAVRLLRHLARFETGALSRSDGLRGLPSLVFEFVALVSGVSMERPDEIRVVKQACVTDRIFDHSEAQPTLGESVLSRGARLRVFS